MKQLPLLLTISLASLLAHGCGRPTVKPENDGGPSVKEKSSRFVECHNGVVVTVSASAAEAGLSILKQGGNAVDAAIATAFALAVVYPPAGNLGGGGFMLVHPAPGAGDPVSFIYRETAPAAATPAMFTKNDTQYTHKAIAVPGTVRGLALAHRRFSTLPWSRLLQPAVKLARDGFLVDGTLVDLLNTYLEDKYTIGHTEFLRVFGRPGGGRWAGGDRLVQPDLARTLQQLADLGPEAFYQGPIADQIMAEMARGHGLITARDLAGYQALECKPLTTRYRGRYDVYVTPPPSAGGVCLLEELNMVQSFDLKAWGRWSPQTVHVMAEAMRRANYDRARFLGDPAFVQIPAYLTTPEYGRQLAAAIDLHKVTRSRDLSVDIPLAPEGPETTHFSIIDHNGMAVANTFTLERLWGSRIVVQNMGFLLNNNMFGFNLFPGVTNAEGTIGTPPNTIAPGKRMVSSMTPTIVAENGAVKLVTGTPGTRAIPNTLLCILVNLFDFGMPVRAAIDAPRFSHEWFPDHISFETPERYPELVTSLNEMGHAVVRTGPRPQGDAHTIGVAGRRHYVGVADMRRNGKAAALGY
jgi:gamma-glutamyltranspeptidase/glutathione hydrolase